MLVSPSRSEPATPADTPRRPRRSRGLDDARNATVVATAVAPPPERRARIWHRPVPFEGRRPLVWLLGAQGGAGVTTLAQTLAPAADCYRMWPNHMTDEHGQDESPFVVVVCRTTIDGLSRAHDLLRQWHTTPAQDRRSVLLGLITMADRPGKMSKPVARYLHVIEPTTPAHWHIEWQPHWGQAPIADLPTWTPSRPGDPPPGKDDPHAAVRQLGDDLIAAATAAVNGTTTPKESAR